MRLACLVSRSKASVNTTDITLPPRADIDDLVRLGQIGYVRGIQDKLAEIERDSAAHTDFVRRMRSIVDRFDLKRFIAMLEHTGGGHG